MIKTILSLFVLWTIFDRIRVTFSKKSAFHPEEVGRVTKIYSILMISLYTIIALSGFYCFVFLVKTPNLILSIVGLLVFLCARALRNSGINALGSQWNSHTSAEPIKWINTTGVYQYSRHPYHLGTFLELVGYSLIFNSGAMGLWVFICFLPLLIVRVSAEEKNLVAKFSDAYLQYARGIPAIFSFKGFYREAIERGDLAQIISIGKLFGLKTLLDIKFTASVVTTYSRGYAVARIAGSLIDLGFIDILQDRGDVNIQEICAEKGWKREPLEVVCDYFVVLGILSKNEFIYRLTKYGRKLFGTAKGPFSLLYAYMPVFENLPEVIKGEKVYGKEIFTERVNLWVREVLS